MAKPYWYNQHNGYIFSRNKLHPEEISSINAQLDGPMPVVSRPQTQPEMDVVAHMTPRRRERYSREHRSTILERLQSSPDLLQKMAEIALKNMLPDRWSVHYTDDYNEQIRDRRLDLLQSLGEAALEAPAA